MADEPTTHTTVIEKRGGGGTMLIAAVLLIAVVIGAFFVFNEGRNDGAQTKAVTEAAGAVEGAAKDVGDAAKKPAN